MKAVRVHKPGDSSVLQIEEMPVPRPGKGEVLVRLKAAGLNYIDIYQRNGLYPSPHPYTPGLEGAGVVEAVGPGVTGVMPGERVAYTGHLGSYAEYNVIDAEDLIPLPNWMSFEQGAAFPLQGMTAHYLIHEFFRIEPGSVVLVHAAAGGVGGLLVQWARRLAAQVIGTVSTEEKARAARDAGASATILYTRQDFAAEVKNLTDGTGADYIIDGVGRSTFPKDLEAVRVRGHICLFGSSSGPAEPFPPNALQARSLTLHGGKLGDFTGTREELLARARDVLLGVQQGWLRLRIDRVLPLELAGEAHRLLEGRKTQGKLILKIGD